MSLRLAGRPAATKHPHNSVVHPSEFVSHSVCNVRRGTGTWFAAGNELADGDAFFFDIGCYGRGGYASDLARTGFVGEPPRAVRRAYRSLLEAHDLGVERARPGIRASQVHEAVNQYLRRQDLQVTPYALGHGVGLRNALCRRARVTLLP